MGDHEEDSDPFAEGRVYPSTMERWPTEDGPWIIALDWKVIDGRIECTGVHLTAAGDGQPVTTTVLRDVKFGETIRRRRAQITAEASTPGRTGMRRSTRARLETAADVYKAAFARGEPPTRAVAAHFGLTSGGASSLVARARAAGLLPPTSPGGAQG